MHAFTQSPYVSFGVVKKLFLNISLHTGKSHGDNIYCKVILGDQEQHTDIGRDNLINGNAPQNGAPQVPMLVWNYSMQFLIRNINEDALTITVFEMCPFQPDGTFNMTWIFDTRIQKILFM